MSLIDRDIWRRTRRRFGPRRFHAFALAPGRTGTHSVAAMFEHYYRSVHEAEAGAVIDLLEGKTVGDVQQEEVREYFRGRDKRLRLEMDASGLNSLFAKELVTEFPKAKFIVTVRDCFSWSNSALNQMLNNPAPSPHWLKLRTLLYGTVQSCTYQKPETILDDHQTWSLDRILAGWSRMYRSVLDAIPADRTLFVYTHNLHRDIPRIARFLKIPPRSIGTDKSHNYKSPKNFDLVGKIESDFVDETADRLCGDIMQELFPGKSCSILTDFRE